MTVGYRRRLDWIQGRLALSKGKRYGPNISHQNAKIAKRSDSGFRGVISYRARNLSRRFSLNKIKPVSSRRAARYDKIRRETTSRSFSLRQFFRLMVFPRKMRVHALALPSSFETSQDIPVKLSTSTKFLRSGYFRLLFRHHLSRGGHGFCSRPANPALGDPGTRAWAARPVSFNSDPAFMDPFQANGPAGPGDGDGFACRISGRFCSLMPKPVAGEFSQPSQIPGWDMVLGLGAGRFPANQHSFWHGFGKRHWRPTPWPLVSRRIISAPMDSPDNLKNGGCRYHPSLLGDLQYDADFPPLLATGGTGSRSAYLPRALGRPAFPAWKGAVSAMLDPDRNFDPASSPVRSSV